MRTCIYLMAWLLCYVTTTPLLAHQPAYQLNYLQKYKDLAIREMLHTGIPASIILSHALLASGAGTDELALEANNHFRVECGTDWTGITRSKLAYNATGGLEPGCFRVYPDAEASFRDFTGLITAPNRIAAFRMLFKLETTDYLGWANGLQLTGFAAGGAYATKLVRIIEDYDLNRYDSIFYTEGKLPERYWAVEEDVPATNGRLTTNEGRNLTDQEYPKRADNEFGFRHAPKNQNPGPDLALASPQNGSSYRPQDDSVEAPPVRIRRYHDYVVPGSTPDHQLGRGYYPVAGNRYQKPDAGFDRDQFAKQTDGPSVILAGYSSGSAAAYGSLPEKSPVSSVFHKTNGQETLAGIARQYRISVKELMLLNGLQSEQITKGMTLRVK